MNFIKTGILAATLAMGQPLTASAGGYEPGAFIGLVWNFGGGAGVTAKAYSSNQPGAANVAAGVTYYFNGSWGADIGIVYYDLCSGGLGFSLGYDFLQSGVQVGVGTLSNGFTFCPPPPH